MKTIRILQILLASLLLGVASPAQISTSNPTQTAESLVTIGGSGNKGYLPKFTGPTQISDSGIVESLEGNIGIGTTVPLYPVHVFATNTAPPGRTAARAPSNTDTR